MKSGFPFLAVCLIASVQAGCGAVHVVRESAARLPTDDSVQQNRGIGATRIEAVAGNVRSFGLVGLVVPFIPVWNSGEDKNEFTIVLTFLPESASDLSFDPQQVALETEQGVLMPTGIFRGDFIADDPQLFIRGNKKQAGPVLLNRELRIWLTFPVKPIPPGDRFSVVLNGLSQSGLPIEALRLEFQRQLSLGIIYFLPTLNIHNMGPSIDTKWVISR